MIVAKFGGTSMGNASAMKQTGDIIKNMKNSKAVVLSATSGTTDRLIELSELALNNKDWQKKLDELKFNHKKIIEDLNISIDLNSIFLEIQKILDGISSLHELSLSIKDSLLVFGERMSTIIFTEYLKKIDIHAEMVDAYNLIFTDNNFGSGNVDLK